VISCQTSPHGLVKRSLLTSRRTQTPVERERRLSIGLKSNMPTERPGDILDT